MADKPPAKPGAKPPAAKFSAPSTPEIIVALLLFLALLPILTGFVFSPSEGGVVATVLTRVLGYVKTLSTIISMLAIAIAVYAFFRIRELAAEEKERLGLALNWNSERTQKNVRWERVEEYMTSANPSDWKIAILEADNMLDEIVERMGYKGETLGDRMKTIEASDFPYLDEAWQAHKLRNAIAHKGTDYPLTRSEADQAILMYYRVFKEFGYLP